MSVLGTKQEIFARLIAKQLAWMLSRPGIEIRGGEWLRTKSQAYWNATHCRICKEVKEARTHSNLRSDWAPGSVHRFVPIGIRRSLHIQKLAIDLNVFRDGVWITDSVELEWAGEHWEAMSGIYEGIEIECCWGGRWRRPDGNHLSIAHQGRK